MSGQEFRTFILRSALAADSKVCAGFADIFYVEIIQFLEDNWGAIIVLICLVACMFPGRRRPVKLSGSFQGRPQASVTTTVTTDVVELTSDDPIFKEITTALERGAIIEAIKILRSAKSIDLTTAKQMIDLLERQKGSANSKVTISRYKL